MESKITKVWVGRTHMDVELPQYKSEEAEGMDVRSLGRCVIFPQQKIVVPTGLITAPEDITSIDIRPRSGISLKTSIEIPNAPGTVDADYRDPIGVIIHNTSLPSYETYVDGSYVKLFNFLKEHGIENGSLTLEDLKFLRSIFGELLNLEEANNNTPGIYVINPGDRIAQIMLRNNNRIEWLTENFLTQEDINKYEACGYTIEQVNEIQDKIREDHLQIVMKRGLNRGGGFGSTGTK